MKDVNGDRVGVEQESDGSRFRRRAPHQFFADRGRPDVSGGDQEYRDRKLCDWNHESTAACAAADGKPIAFKRTQKLNFWMQVYNLSVDEKTHKPSATFEYDVVNTATNKAVVHTTESTEQMGNIGDQVTLQKTLSAGNLQPGLYRLEIKVNDNISKQTVGATATFSVE